MKETGILLSNSMVRATHEDRKTMTRRIIEPQPDENGVSYMAAAPCFNWESGSGQEWKRWYWDTEEGERITQNCHYGVKGDLLYVRETHYCYGNWVGEPYATPGQHTWRFVPDPITMDLYYEENPPLSFRISRDTMYPENLQWYKRLGRFMPKEYARIWLEITNVRVERLQAISEEDAIAEGVERAYSSLNMDSNDRMYKNYMYPEDTQGFYSPVVSFETLWKSIYGPDSWDANPWVWVIVSKVLSKIGKPSS